ncbi:AAA family ATPase [Gammaproteobacteria bacterium]|nr:AAA family ATPase [Gammaproteobacteria bacterium]
MTELKDLLTKKEKKERWLIKNFIGMGEIAVMYAPIDHHKTGMALKIAMEVITGGEELGASQSGKVLYYSLDTPELEMVLRAKALAENQYPNSAELIGSNLSIDFDDQGSSTEKDFNLVSDYYWWDDDYDEEADVKGGGLTWFEVGKYPNDNYRLIIIDTLSKAIVGSGINDDISIRKVIHNLRNWIKGSGYNFSILLIHHTGKDARKGMMGSSLLGNDISTVFRIRKKKDGFELFREKSKSGYKGKSIPFKFRTADVEHNNELHESVYVDIGAGLDELNAEIVSQYNNGSTKKEIKETTYLLGLGNTTTDKSFGVVFNRRWKTLIDTGFISEKETGNKTTD